MTAVLTPPSAAGQPAPGRSPAPAGDGSFGHQPALDGIRALAVVAVILFHFDFRWIPGGFLGVDVFFVVSGFLITSLLLEESRSTGRVSLRQFWLRRARRLLPALYLVLVVTTAAAVVWAEDALARLKGDVLAALAYVTNWWLIASGESYFDALGRPPVLRHLWSLAVEEQWYLLWPLALLGGLRLAKGRSERLALPVALAAVASAVWMALLYDPAADASRVYFGTDTRLSGLLLGAAAAMVWMPWRWRGAGPRRAGLDLAGLGALGLLVVLVLVWGEDTTLLYRGGFFVVAVLTVILVATAVHPGSTTLRRGLAVTPLVWIGVRSYGLYLWHWPVVTIFRQRDLGWSRPATVLFWTVLTVVLAELSYRFVEQPIRHGAIRRSVERYRASGYRRRRETRLRVQLAGLVAAVVLVGLAVRVVGADRVDIVTGGEAQALELTTTVAPTANAVAGTTPAVAGTTPISLPREVAVVGDSQALSLVRNTPEGLGAYLSLVDGSVEGCGLYDEGNIVTTARFRRGFGNCNGWKSQWAQTAVDAEVTLVVLGAWDVFDLDLGDRVLRFGTPEHDAYLKAQLQGGIQAIEQGGSQVALLEVPCYRNVDGGGLVALPERSDDQRTGHLNDLLRQAAAADPTRVFFVEGPDAWCQNPEIAEDLAYRWDGVHYYRPGAKLVYDTITPQLVEIPPA